MKSLFILLILIGSTSVFAAEVKHQEANAGVICQEELGKSGESATTGSSDSEVKVIKND